MKQCNVCLLTKADSEFYCFFQRGKNTLQPNCKDCYKTKKNQEYCNKKLQENPNYVKKEVSDLTGQTFGYLTVIEFAGYIKINSKERLNKNVSAWLCRCKCSNEKIIPRQNIIRGNTKSCGCRGTGEKRKVDIDLTDRRVGKLLVLCFLERIKSVPYWLCQCDCGNKISVRYYQLLSLKTKSCGCLNFRKGKDHPQYRHDISDEERLEAKRNMTPGLKTWKPKVLEHDNWTCQLTGIRINNERKHKSNMNVHHIFNFKDYKTLRAVPNNGITLHKHLHKLFHKLYGSRFTTLKQFQEFNTRYKSGEFTNYITNKIPELQITDYNRPTRFDENLDFYLKLEELPIVRQSLNKTNSSN